MKKLIVVLIIFFITACNNEDCMKTGVSLKYISGFEFDLNWDGEDDIVLYVQRKENYTLFVLLKTDNSYSVHAMDMGCEFVDIECRNGPLLKSRPAKGMDAWAAGFGNYLYLSGKSEKAAIFWNEEKFQKVSLSDPKVFVSAGIPLAYYAGYECDFNYDNRDDIVFYYRKDEENIILSLVQKNKEYTAYEITKDEQVGILRCSDISTAIGSPAVYEEEKKVITNGSSILVTYSGTSSVLYYWEADRFNEIWISD